MKSSELIYDWNRFRPRTFRIDGGVLLNDETLRDGLQSPSVRDPCIGEKIEILHLMESLGINSLDLGLPGAGPRAVEHSEALAREIVASKLKIRANCAARTHENDIRPVAEIQQRTGLKIEAATFLGSSPIRRYTEGWTDDFLLRTTEHAIKFAVSLGVEPMYVTEDTTRCDPEMIRRLYTTAIGCGARAIVICDTAGHATPMGTLALVRFVIEEVVKPSDEKIRVDWHGHCDRGMGTANAMAALMAGADCVHATALGIGERVGNTQMDQMLVNLTEWHCALGRPGSYQVEGLLHRSLPCHRRSHSRKLSGRWRRRFPHRYRSACRRGHQGIQEERSRTGEYGLFWRAVACLRPGASHRHRPYERPLEHPVLAGTSRHSCDGGGGRANLPARQVFGPRTERSGSVGVPPDGESSLKSPYLLDCHPDRSIPFRVRKGMGSGGTLRFTATNL